MHEKEEQKPAGEEAAAAKQKGTARFKFARITIELANGA